jgi:hypothetical protein
MMMIVITTIVFFLQLSVMVIISHPDRCTAFSYATPSHLVCLTRAFDNRPPISSVSPH